MDVTSALTDFTSAMQSLVEKAKDYLPEPLASGVDAAQKAVGAKDGTVTVDISPEYQDLINKQIQAQTELQQVTFLSNIERTNHEARMAPVRNIRLA